MAYSPIEESYMNGFVTTQFATPEPEPVLLAENKNISYPGEQFTDTGGGAAVGTRLNMPKGLNTPENIQKVGGEILPAGAAIAKGGAQASVGMYGDIEGLGRMVLNYMGVDINKDTKLPTTEDVKSFLDKYIPVDEKYATFEKAGELASPAGAYGLGKAGIKAIKSTKGMPVGMSIKAANAKEFSEAIKNEVKGLELDLYESSNGNKLVLSKIALPKEDRKSGIGTEVMNEVVKFADSQDKTIALSPSTDFGGTSVSRLKEFYKTFGFVENKGRNKDLSISETMYRLPAKENK